MKKIFIIVFAALIGLSSCDMLDKTPQSTLVPETYFKSETDLQLFSNTFYNNMLDKSPFDNQSDQMITKSLDSRIKGGSYRDVPASGGGWTWTDLRKINYMLENMPKQCEDEALVAEYSGLCRFFRTYFYYEKLIRFGDVPWVDKELASTDTAVYSPRVSREYIMQRIVEDIDFAIDNLPEGKSTYRVNKWTALALKSRLCLFEASFRKYHKVQINASVAGVESVYTVEDYYQMAADAAYTLITEGPYTLFTTGNPKSDYSLLFSQDDASSDEYILAIAFNYALNIRHNATAFSLLDAQPRPGYSKKTINAYLMKDGSRFTDKTGYETFSFLEETKDRDPRLGQTIRIPGYVRFGETEKQAPNLTATVTGYQPTKYVMAAGSNSGMCDRTSMSSNDLPVFRLAEVMLNYAEAKAELGTITQEDVDLTINALRKRVDMAEMNLAAVTVDPYLTNRTTGYSNPVLLASDNLGIVLEVRRERLVELSQEGDFRYFDLMRWAEGECLNQDIYGIFFSSLGDHDLDGDGQPDVCLYEGSKPTTKATYLLKIGTDIVLTDGTYGYVDPCALFSYTDRYFNTLRDYLYPIPTDDRSLYNAAGYDLTQNPGWDDGLEF